MIFYFVIPKFTKGIMVFLSWETIFLLKKNSWCVLLTPQQVGVTRVLVARVASSGGQACFSTYLCMHCVMFSFL
jgi:hypothetical protein